MSVISRGLGIWPAPGSPTPTLPPAKDANVIFGANFLSDQPTVMGSIWSTDGTTNTNVEDPNFPASSVQIDDLTVTSRTVAGAVPATLPSPGGAVTYTIVYQLNFQSEKFLSHLAIIGYNWHRLYLPSVTVGASLGGANYLYGDITSMVTSDNYGPDVGVRSRPIFLAFPQPTLAQYLRIVVQSASPIQPIDFLEVGRIIVSGTALSGDEIQPTYQYATGPEFGAHLTGALTTLDNRRIAVNPGVGETGKLGFQDMLEDDWFALRNLWRSCHHPRCALIFCRPTCVPVLNLSLTTPYPAVVDDYPQNKRAYYAWFDGERGDLTFKPGEVPFQGDTEIEFTQPPIPPGL
jgi:hypothetical protein